MEDHKIIFSSSLPFIPLVWAIYEYQQLMSPLTQVSR
jgi:hypothetical protein